MILIDDREDARLAAELSRFDVPVHVLRLPSGDACWTGSGPSGSVQVGFEHKRLTDLIQCMQDRRLSGSQLRAMWVTYDRVEIVLEGIWRPTANGSVEVLSGREWTPLYYKQSGISYFQLDGYIQSLSEVGNVRFWRTLNVTETALLYLSRFRWWQKPYSQHHSCDQIYSTDPKAQKRGRMVLHEGDPNPVCQVAAQVPHIDRKAWDVGKQFASVRDMANAGVAEWMDTEWTDSGGNVKHFGRRTATEIVGWFRGSWSKSGSVNGAGGQGKGSQGTRGNGIS